MSGVHAHDVEFFLVLLPVEDMACGLAYAIRRCLSNFMSLCKTYHIKGQQDDDELITEFDT